MQAKGHDRAVARELAAAMIACTRTRQSTGQSTRQHRWGRGGGLEL